LPRRVRDVQTTDHPVVAVVVALLLVGTVAAALVVALLLVDAAAPTVATCAAALAGLIGAFVENWKTRSVADVNDVITAVSAVRSESEVLKTKTSSLLMMVRFPRSTKI